MDHFFTASEFAWHPDFWDTAPRRRLLARPEDGLLTSSWAQFNLFGNPMDGSYGSEPLMPKEFGNFLSIVAPFVLDELLVPARETKSPLSVGAIAKLYFSNGARIYAITSLLRRYEQNIERVINHEQVRISRAQFNFLVLLFMVEAAREADEPLLTINHDGAIRRDDGSIDLTIAVELTR